MAAANPEPTDVATVSDSDEESDDEELKRVLELSLLDVGGPCSSKQTDDDEELKRALEISVLSEPLIKLSGTLVCNIVHEENDSEAELEEALRRSLLDTGNVNDTKEEGIEVLNTVLKFDASSDVPQICDTLDEVNGYKEFSRDDINDDLATLEEIGGVESDQDFCHNTRDKSITKDLQEIEESGMEDTQDNVDHLGEDAVKEDLAGIEQLGVVDDGSLNSEESSIIEYVEKKVITDPFVNNLEPETNTEKTFMDEKKKGTLDERELYLEEEKKDDLEEKWGNSGEKENEKLERKKENREEIKTENVKETKKEIMKENREGPTDNLEDKDQKIENLKNKILKVQKFNEEKAEKGEIQTFDSEPIDNNEEDKISVDGSSENHVNVNEDMIESTSLDNNDSDTDSDFKDQKIGDRTVDLTHDKVSPSPWSDSDSDKPVDLTDDCDTTVDLTTVTPKNVVHEVIDISDDEVDSTLSLTTALTSSTSILIDSDTSPPSRPDLAAIGARLGGSVSITTLAGAGSSNGYNNVLSDSDDEIVVLDCPTPGPSAGPPPGLQPGPFTVRPPLHFSPQVQPALSTQEVTMKMKTVFESGLAIHLSGEEMEASKAVSTPLFPHQRVALAWMFKHENKENDGMRGGILADDMGLGKTLTVIALIVTNHWDGKPLSKPEMGYTRPSFNYGKRVATRARGNGKGKVGGAFKPKGESKDVGGPKKSSIGGLFDNFYDTSSDSDSHSDTEKRKKPRMKKKRSTSNDDDEMKDFIDDGSADSTSNSDHSFGGSEDEFDKMSKDTSLQEKLNASASSIFNRSKELFKKESNPRSLKDTQFNKKEEEKDSYKDVDSESDFDDANMTQEELMLSMIPTALDGTYDLDFDQKMNVDGIMDAPSSEEESNLNKKFGGHHMSASESVDDITTSTATDTLKRKLSVESEQISQNQNPAKRSKNCPWSDSDSDNSQPVMKLEKSTSSKEKEDKSEKKGEPEKILINEETGLKLIIPPEELADRGERRRATLLVCPTSLMSHWVDQLHEHLHRGVKLKLKVHHGSGKALTGADLAGQDIVITTYGTLAAEWGAGDLRPLSRAKWLRVVLDEGHNIKNHNTKSAKAALGLDTIRRWIVTGTPIQNNLMELWSLVNWLDFGMYAGKSQMNRFKNQIEGPCKKGNPRGFERLQVLVDAICLRRTKSDKKPDGSPLVALPSKKIITRDVVMSEEERLCYGVYLKRAKEIVGKYNRRGDLLRNYAHVFALMTRLRQLCCHRELIKEVDWVEALKDKEGLAKQLEGFLDKDQITENSAGSNGLEVDLERRLVGQLREMIMSGISEDCSVCLDELRSPVITPCAHVFCRHCIEAVLDTVKPTSCPLCRKILTKQQLLEAGQDESGEKDNTLADMKDIEVNVSSSKVNAVLKEMLRIQRDMPDDKIVVVSQFTSFLSILQPIMKQKNFSLVRLDGSMTHMDRSEAVRVFQSSKKSSPKVMLLSLKAGGVGLNLTAANHLLLLDPAWNPASEWQCFDRTHRLGQKKDVHIYKYITKESIEEKMLEIQAKKKDLISGAFHMPEEKRRRERVQDIMNIFGI